MPEFRKVLAGLWLWIVLLQHVMAITTVNLEKKGVIYAANITNAHTTLKLTIDKALLTSASNDMLLVFYGHAFTFYDIKAGEKDDMKLVCSGADWTICVLNLNDQRPYFNGFRGYQVEINLNERIAATFSFAVEDHIVGYIGLPYTIIGNSLDTVKMRLMGSNDQSFDKLRFEFVALTTTHHADRTSLSAVGNFGVQKGWPTAQQHDFSLQHLHGTEIAGVFDDRNPQFCTASSKCDYKFEIKAQNAHTINLNSNFARKIEDITDNGTAADQALYSMAVSSEYKNSDLVITLETLEGTTELYANFVVPETAELSTYKAPQAHTKTLVIPAEDLKQPAGIVKIHQLYLIVKSRGPAKYYIRAIYRDSRTSEIIKPNLPVTSHITEGRMFNYVIQVRTTQKEEVMKYRVEVSGDSLIPYVYAKHCRDPETCGFFDNKVVTDKVPFEKEQLKYDESSVGKKELIVPFVCGKDTMSVVTKINELVTEYLCLLNIGVYATKTGPKGSLFTIVIHDTSQRLILPVNTWKRIGVHIEEDQRLQYNLHTRDFNDLESVQLRFDLVYGAGSAYISRANPSPCDLKDLLGTLPLSGPGTHSLSVSPAQLPNKQLGGPFYICIKATSRLQANIGLFPQLTPSAASQDPILSHVQELPPNEQLLTVLEPGQMVYYSFSQFLSKNSSESINIHLTPIKGTFRMAVTANGGLPSPKQTFWNVVGDHLEIRPRDPAFREHARYIIGVSLEAKGPNLAQNEKYKFLISHSLSERHTMLRSGVPTSASIHKVDGILQARYYQIEIPLNATSFTLLKTCFENHITIYLSLDLNNGYPASGKTDFVMNPYNSGIHLTQQQLNQYSSKQKLLNKEQTHLVAYLAVYTSSETKYWIQYTVNDEPFTVPENGPVGLPIFTLNSRLKLVYHIHSEHPFEIELRPTRHQVVMYAQRVPEADMHKTAFPTNLTHNNDTFILDTADSHVLRLPASPSAFHQVLLVTLELKNHLYIPYLPQLADGIFQFFTNGFLEIGNHEKHLSPGSVRHDTAELGETRYFRIHHTINTKNIVIDVRTSKGYLHVFVGKGGTLPDEKNHIVHRICAGDELITIDKSHIQAFDVLSGDYIVALRGEAASGAAFTIMYRSENLEVFTLELGNPAEFRVRSNQVQYFELLSTIVSVPIEIAYRSRHAKVSLYVLPYKGGEQKMPKPSQEHYGWMSTMASDGGFGRLLIKPDSPDYCTMCTYVIRVQTDMDDTIELMASMRSPLSPIRLHEGRDYIGYLGKGETDSYIMTVPYNESSFNLEINVIKGNVTLYYSTDPTFNNSAYTRIVKEKVKDEFFSINFGQISSFLRGYLKVTLTRYLKVVAEEDSSEYVLTVVSDEMISRLRPLESRHSILGAGVTHYYYFKTDTAQPGDISFHLRNILHGSSTVDYNHLVQKIPSLVKLYHSPDFKDVQDRKFDYKLESEYDMFQRELRAGFRTRPGYTVVRVRNELSHPIQYSLLLSLGHIMRLSTKHDLPDHISGYHKRTYLISNQLGGMQAQVKFRQCLGEVEAKYAYIKRSNVFANQTGAPEAEQWHTLVNHQVNNALIPTRDDTDTVLAVENIAAGGTGEPKSVYLVNMELHKDGNFDTGLDGPAVVLGDIQKNGEVDIFTDSDQAVKFSALVFHPEFIKSHSDYKVFVNYTLFMSTKPEMMRFMRNCDTYRISTAEQILQTTNRYSFSTYETYELKDSDSRSYNPRLMIKPHTMSFGGFYHGVVVAEVKFWRTSDERSFPRAENLRVYYNEFTFEPADFSVALVFMLSLLGIGVVVVLVYFLIRYKVLDSFKHKSFVKDILKEFDEEQVGNNLVMEIMDYKKKKERTVGTSLNSSADTEPQSQDTSMISAREPGRSPSPVDLSPEISKEMELSQTAANN